MLAHACTRCAGPNGDGVTSTTPGDRVGLVDEGVDGRGGRPSSSVYHGTMVTVERVQTGVRMERRLLKVLKGLAEYLDLSLGDLLEGIVLHAFEQKPPFDDATVEVIQRLRQVYGLDLTARDSHHLHSADEAST